MEILQLKYFLHAAKTENFSHTAKNFCVPTSCVSASIKKLETEIGVPLFDRTANKVALNQYGKILLCAAEKSEELLNKAKADILDLTKTAPEEIKILILSNRQRVTEVISEFKLKHPETSFIINHQSHTSELDIKKFDVIVSDKNINSSAFLQKFWFSEEIFFAVHKTSAFSKKSSVCANEIKDEKLICMPKESSIRHCMDIYFSENEISPTIVIECDDPLYIRNYLKIGLGATFFPSVAWKNQINSDIKLLKIDNGLYRNSYIYTNKASSQKAHIFSQMLEIK